MTKELHLRDGIICDTLENEAKTVLSGLMIGLAEQYWRHQGNLELNSWWWWMREEFGAWN